MKSIYLLRLSIWFAIFLILSNLLKSLAEEKPNPMTQIVIVEGVGANGDEALKDAFRNAVRQVVGAVVDAETLIKNDELISDKVLTYSGGCVKKYDEISKKENKGLVRIKIKAEVENKEVIAKLKAANVKVKDFDGKGLFAEVVTELNREKDAAALLKKAFEGFPQNCIEVSVTGNPEIVKKDNDKVTVKLLVKVDLDFKAYYAFSTGIVSQLEKLSKSNGEFTAKFKEGNGPNLRKEMQAEPTSHTRLLAEWVPAAFDGNRFPRLKEKQVTLAVATNRTNAGDKIDYRYFQLEPSLQLVLVEIVGRKGQGKLQLFNSSGETIISERFSVPTLFASFGDSSGNGDLYELGLQLRHERYADYKNKAKLFFINPVFFAPRTNHLAHQPYLTIPVETTLGLEELKSVKNTRCEIKFND